MKKLQITLLFVLATFSLVKAGGIVTNTNQSAAWIRMLTRDASVDVDAVYYNPAGVMMLADGFYFQLNNQTIKQKREIVNKFPLLNSENYVGDVFVPALPTAFFVYKKNKFAVHGGFTVIGGGGSANYATGLPSFEIPISQIPASLTANGIPTTDYSADIAFDGSSVYYGMQLGAAYKVNDMISVSAGGRYVLVKNSYKGHIHNILINPNYPAFGTDYNGANMVSANKFFTDGASFLNTLSAGSTQMAAGLQQIVNGGGGSVLLSNGTAVGMTAAQVAQAQQLVGAAGQNPVGMNIQTAQLVLTGAAPVFKAKADGMTTNANSTKDLDVDATQSGGGISPIIGVNLNLLESKLNIGIKYEGQISMKVKNETKVDGSGLFKDGDEVASDMPAILTMGVSYLVVPNLTVCLGGHYYFDRNADYGKTEKDATGAVIHSGNKYFIDENSYEAAFGLEFRLNENLVLSTGYLYASTSPALAYQTDMSYSLKSHTIGFGGNYKVTPRLGIDLGILYTSNVLGEKSIDYKTFGTHKETYYKNNVVGSIGLTYHFGGGETLALPE